MEILHKITEICRVCLEKQNDMFSLYESNEITNKSPFDILVSFSKVQTNVSESSKPQQICRCCLNRANESWLFKNQYEKSEIALKYYLTQNNISNEFIKQSIDGNLATNDPSLCKILEVTLKSEGCAKPSKEDGNRNIDIFTHELNIETPIKHKKFKRHRQLKPLVNESNIYLKLKLSKDSLECSICNRGFKYRNCYAKHMLQHTGKIRRSKARKIDVNNCSSKNKTKDKEISDIDENILDEIETNLKLIKNETKGPQRCNICGKSFTHYSNLRQHLVLHMPSKSHLCSICGKSFTQKHYLSIHMRTHSTERPYCCNVCGMGFKQRAGLYKHKVIHTNNRSHVCSVCGQTFKRIGDLKGHMVKHSDERKYQCSICTNKFKSASNLKNHVLTHTGEKNYICPTCGKSFNRSGNLAVHCKIHSGERPHVCNVCDKAFLYKHCLQNHMKTHDC